MRRQVVTEQCLCDLCRAVAGTYPCGGMPGSGWGTEVGPLDFCWRCRDKARPCESCGSLPTFPDPQATWAGNCLACWRLAMTLPRGKCGAVSGLGILANPRHSCDQLANHPDAHHCPDCGENWGLR